MLCEVRTHLNLILVFLLVTVLLQERIIDGSLQSDTNALLAFRRGLIDPKKALRNWNITTINAPCDWRGVVCSGGNVIGIQLPRARLQGPLLGVGDLGELIRLSLHSNNLSGSLSKALANATKLRVVYLQNNLFEGEIFAGIANITQLQVFNAANNKLTGRIPDTVSSLKFIRKLDLSINALYGGIPPQLSNSTRLTYLDFSVNNLTGDIPDSLGHLQLLKMLNLSFNSLVGNIPPSLGNCSRLVSLDVRKNNLSDVIPAALGSLQKLQLLNAGSNKLSGNLPGSLGSLRELQILNVEGNFLSGQIPFSIGDCSALQVLDLSNNHFTGNIPSQFSKLTQLENLKLEGNMLSGTIPSSISRCRNLTGLNLGKNNLVGIIPPELGLLIVMVQLQLDSNRLSGSIPSQLSNAARLQVLDLSNNRLTGKIPSSLDNIANLRTLNLSYNKLQGLIPVGLASRFGPASFVGNAALCGSPLPNAPCNKTKRISKLAIIGIGLAAGLAGLLLFLILIIVLLLLFVRKPVQVVTGTSSSYGDELVMFYEPILYGKLLEATKQFDEECVLERTKCGTSYKACLEDGTVVCVKKVVCTDESVFREGAERLGRVKHRNLLVLRGYYYSTDVRLLVYDYMPNGNLSILLQQASHQQDGSILDWRMRHLIAFNIARGVEFLHTHCDPPIPHGDIRPHNVHFDADFEPHLSEFGMEKLGVVMYQQQQQQQQASSSAASTPVQVARGSGYVAPEEEVTCASDVYSFGILLLELLTGRRVRGDVDEGDEEDIVKWVKRKVQSRELSEMFEGVMDEEWEEFVLAVKVGLLCTATDPNDRPSMTEAAFMLQGCRATPPATTPS